MLAAVGHLGDLMVVATTVGAALEVAALEADRLGEVEVEVTMVGAPRVVEVVVAGVKMEEMTAAVEEVGSVVAQAADCSGQQTGSCVHLFAYA